jgi:hypothetical protein
LAWVRKTFCALHVHAAMRSSIRFWYLLAALSLLSPRVAGVHTNHLSEKSLALIGNASGQGAEGASDCFEAFSIRRLEGRRWQWWALLWSCGRDLAPLSEGESLGMRAGKRCYARWGSVEGIIPRSARSQEPAIRRQFCGSDVDARRRAGTRLRAVGLGWDHEVSDSLHRKASCCAVRLGPMDMLAPQRGQRQVAN